MELRRPKDLDWSERASGRETNFVLTPSRLNAIPVLVFASLWDSFFIMLWAGLSRAHAPRQAFLFPLAHAAVGVVVTWMALVRCFNVTTISITLAQLVVQHSPIPARGMCLVTETIDHFEVYEPANGNGKGAIVRAVTRDGAAVTLGLTLDGRDEVAYVATRLNLALATARGGPT
jgi:hypothetical protein